MPTLLERAQDRLGHLNLAGPMLILRVRACDEAAWAEDFFHNEKPVVSIKAEASA
jgi:hypothetical protein